MTANIIRCNPSEAYDLIFTEYLSMLSNIDQETMQRAMKNSTHIWIGSDDDDILAMWGLIPPTLMSDVAYLWLFTTRHLNSHVFMFIRHSKRVIEEALQFFPTITGHVEVSNRRARQWLQWLGAEFTSSPNEAVLFFTIKAPQWQQDSAQSA